MKPKVKDESSIYCTVFQQFQLEEYKWITVRIEIQLYISFLLNIDIDIRPFSSREENPCKTPFCQY